jgi:Uma2 family endonuclease
MKAEEPDLNLSYTYADYLKWDLPEMVELIRGKIYKMSPAPSSGHQRVSGNLFVAISLFLKKKKCEVFAAPFDVRLPGKKDKSDKGIESVVQPDICVVCDSTKIDDEVAWALRIGLLKFFRGIPQQKTSGKNLNFMKKPV